MSINTLIVATISRLTAALAAILFSLALRTVRRQEIKGSFECGFASKNKYNSRFSVNYFFLAIILVVFDLEVIVIALSINYQISATKMLSLLAFLVLFTALLVYE